VKTDEQRLCAICGEHANEHPVSHHEFTTEKPIAEISAAAIKSDGSWIRFGREFYHGCCDCGLSHLVEIRRAGDQHEVRFKAKDDLTMETRMSERHPLWEMVTAMEKRLSELEPDTPLSAEGEQMVERAFARFQARLKAIRERRHG